VTGAGYHLQRTGHDNYTESSTTTGIVEHKPWKPAQSVCAASAHHSWRIARCKDLARNGLRAWSENFRLSVIKLKELLNTLFREQDTWKKRWTSSLLSHSTKALRTSHRLSSQWASVFGSKRIKPRQKLWHPLLYLMMLVVYNEGLWRNKISISVMVLFCSKVPVAWFSAA
jgi:hypothetical protein